jgi:hypothetical protein
MSSPFANPLVGHMPILGDYRAGWLPNQTVQGQGTQLGFVRQDVAFVCPFYQDPSNEWSFSSHLRAELFHTGGTILPDTMQPFPEELYSIRLATTYRHLLDNGWILGGAVSVGSASDQPFHGIQEMTAGINAFLRVPSGEHNAWLFSINYSSNSELPIPIPGVAYIWQPSDCFRANIGLPFQLWYRAREDVTLEFTYMLLTMIHARATYHLLPTVRTYVGFDWENESYLLVNRPDERDRFFYYDMRISVGMQWTPRRNATLDVSGGYSFDRYYFEGRNFNDQNFNRVNVDDGPYLAAQLKLHW